MPSPAEVTVVIIAPPGYKRDGLRVLLRAYDRIALAGEADNLASAVQLITERAPALAVLKNGENGDAPWAGLRQLKTQYPQVQFVVLVLDHSKEEQARAAGADAVLLEGFTSETMFRTIDQMMATV